MLNFSLGPPKKDYRALLGKNKDKNFVQRIFNPVLSLQEGNNNATHKMAYGEADGKFIAYPTVVQQPNTNYLTSIDNSTNKFAAMDYALANKEYIDFNTEAEAKDFAEGGYKTNTPLADFNRFQTIRNFEPKLREPLGTNSREPVNPLKFNIK